jgi:tight adherence protein B
MLMLVLVLTVFIGVFMVLALLMLAGGAEASQRTKQTLANLDSALASNLPQLHELTMDLRKNERLSAVPWINRWLQQIELAPRIRLLLQQADLNWTTGRLLVMMAICFIIPCYLFFLRSHVVIFSLLIGTLAGYAPLAFVFAKQQKRFNAFEQGLPEALDLMVSALRAGHSLVAALRLVAHESMEPIRSEFRVCFEEQNYGLELRVAMDNLVNRMPLQDLRIVVTAILIQKESGGNLAEVLDKAAQLIRDRFRLKRQVRIHTAQGRMTGWILSFLPLVLGVLLYLVNPATMSILWTRPIGQKLLFTAAGMTLAGAAIIRKIVNMEV